MAAGVTEEGLGSHAVRHLFGAQLKKKRVAVEDRADLLGHGGDSETSERYCEPHEIATLLELVMKLPMIGSAAAGYQSHSLGGGEADCTVFTSVARKTLDRKGWRGWLSCDERIPAGQDG